MLPKTRKQKKTPNPRIVLGQNRRQRDTQAQFFFFPSNPTRVIFRPVLHCLSHSSSLSFTPSLSGILAAILALGSHLSFGGTRAFLLADGTPTRAHKKQTHTWSGAASASLSLHGLKDKKTYRGHARLMEGMTALREARLQSWECRVLCKEEPPVQKLHRFNGAERRTPGELVKCWKTCRKKLQHVVCVSKGCPLKPNKSSKKFPQYLTLKPNSLQRCRDNGNGTLYLKPLMTSGC